MTILYYFVIAVTIFFIAILVMSLKAVAEPDNILKALALSAIWPVSIIFGIAFLGGGLLVVLAENLAERIAKWINGK